jgi:DNA polymerase III subunit alpha
MGRWGNAHTHSNYSVLDGMTAVPTLVAKAAVEGHAFVSLTDHGNMAGTVKLYKEAKKFDIPCFPGIETYLIDPDFDGKLEDSGKAGRFHLGLLALDLKGYQALVAFTSKTHTRPRFNRFARCTLEDLASLGIDAGAHIALTTGCFFGLTQQTLLRDGEIKAMRVVKMLNQWFPHTFVELQNHGIIHEPEEGADMFPIMDDNDMVSGLTDIASRLGLPVLATQDNHYCKQGEKKAHALMKRMVYGGVEDEFPGDSFHLASEDWVGEHYERDVWEDALDGCDHLLSMNKLSIPPLDKFQTHVPEISKAPNGQLQRMCYRSLQDYLKTNRIMRKRPYEERLTEELRVIKKVGMANYFLHMLEAMQWCQRKGFAIEARGSANGSLVCFLIGLTQVDPIKWNTMFERFLSEDRIQPPDVDMDIEDVARPEVLRYLNENYETVQIGTFGELGARELDQKGSVIVSYQGYLRRMCIEKSKQIERDKAAREDRKPVMGEAERIGIATFNKRYGWIKDLDDVKKHDKRDWIALKQIANMKSVYRSYGVHASGVLISGKDFSFKDWVPTMLVASSDTSVTQYDMHDVEEFGMLKGDWLGQKSLNIMKRCQQLIGRTNPTDFTWIPMDDPDATMILREGRMDNGIFHFEGYTKAKGGKEMKIASTNDAVLATALYMPGATESGQKDLYLKNRRRPNGVYYIHEIFENALKDTLGAVIYQEQTLSVLRGLGMDPVSVNKMFKVIKDSGKGAIERNMERIKEFKVEFENLALDAGMDERDLDEAWHLTTGFVSYGFNRAHATAYGIRSYRCAYLKAHYPLEFMTAVLQANAGNKKEPIYVKEARRIGIKVLPPHVNISGASWVLDRRKEAIRRGLVSVPGIGAAAAEEIEANAPYESLTDMAKKCRPKAVPGGKGWLEEGKIIGAFRKLEDAGALDGIRKA